MVNDGDLYELAKILGHSTIKMTERDAKLARQPIESKQQQGSENVMVILNDRRQKRK
jgi:hypothetical protein